jgi:plastocyanin
MPARRLAAAVGIALGAIALAGCGGGGNSAATTTDTTTTAAGTTPSASSAVLLGTVGPGFDISLTMENGDQIAALKPGTYTIKVDDKSDIHNFHLTGPGGVDESTSVSETGNTTWTVTLVDGKYHYQCDPHASQMNGDFEVSG